MYKIKVAFVDLFTGDSIDVGIFTCPISNNEIDDAVSAWHNDSITELPLHSYLGMTEEEYARWVENSSSIKISLEILPAAYETKDNFLISILESMQKKIDKEFLLSELIRTNSPYSSLQYYKA